MNNVITVSGNYFLSAFRKDDADTLVQELNDRDFYRFTLAFPYPFTSKDAQVWLDKVMGESAKQGVETYFALRDLKGAVVGSVGLFGFEYGKSHQAEIGYWLAKPYWGKGLTSLAVNCLVQYAFDVLGLSRITAHVIDGNAQSVRVLEKCGFQREGFLRGHIKKDGTFYSAILYAIISEKLSQDLHLSMKPDSKAAKVTD